MLRERGHLPPVQPGEPSPFALADSERLAGMLDAAGLVMPRVEEIAVTMSYRDAADYLVVSGELSPFGRCCARCPPARSRSSGAASSRPGALPDRGGLRRPGRRARRRRRGALTPIAAGCFTRPVPLTIRR